MEQLALARKWRPRQFNELVGQQHVVTAMANALNNQKLHHAYLLTGTRGVGKTTIARIIAKCLNCEQGVSANPCGKCNSCQEVDNGRFVDLYEIDAASRTKVEDTRDLLDNVQYAPTKGRYKVYLIDEVHMLSGHSFNALLKTLEEPPEHVKFILATTDPEKMPATVLSRCLQFHLLALLPEQISDHLGVICNKEGINSESEALQLLANAANGSLRDALSLLDQAIAFGNMAIDTTSVRQMLGTIDPSHLFDLIDALIQHQGEQLLSTCSDITTMGCDFAHVLSDLLALLHRISVLQQVPQAANSDEQQLVDLSKRISAEDTQLFYQIGLVGQRDLSLAPSARIGFEVILMRMLAFYPDDSVAATPAPAAPSSQQQKPATRTQQHSTKPAASTNKPQQRNTTANKAATPENNANLDDQRWFDWVQKMQLKGAALILAQNCTILEYNNDQLHLALDAPHKPLLQKKYTDRINDAINQLLGKPIKLNISVKQNVSNTPNEITKQKAQQNQSAAEKNINNDPNVQAIKDHFDAEIISGSIVPNDKT